MEFNILEKTFSIIVGIYGLYYRIKSVKVKKLSFEKSHLAKELPKTLQISNLEKIDNNNHLASVSNVVIWNSGNMVIYDTDFPKKKKLTINISDSAEIFNLKLIFNNDTDNNINFTIEKNHISIDFDFLEPKKGFIIEILHNGESDSDLAINGRIIGGKEVRRLFDISRNVEKKDHWSADLIAVFVGSAFILFPIFRERTSFIDWFFSIFLITFGALLIIIVIVKFISNIMPKNLKEKFYEN